VNFQYDRKYYSTPKEVISMLFGGTVLRSAQKQAKVLENEGKKKAAD